MGSTNLSQGLLWCVFLTSGGETVKNLFDQVPIFPRTKVVMIIKSLDYHRFNREIIYFM